MSDLRWKIPLKNIFNLNLFFQNRKPTPPVHFQRNLKCIQFAKTCNTVLDTMLMVVSKSQMIRQFMPTFAFLICSFARLSCVKVYFYCKSIFIFQCFCLLCGFSCKVGCVNGDCVVACRFGPAGGFLFNDGH